MTVNVEALKKQLAKVSATKRAVDRAEKAFDEKQDAYEAECRKLEALSRGEEIEEETDEEAPEEAAE